MPISMTFSNESADGILADLQRIFPALVTGAGLPPMQEQPRENREPLPAENVKEIEAPKRTRKTKDKEAPAEAAADPSPSESTDTPSPIGETTDSTTTSPAEIPDIEDLRARLKTLGATEGFGHDKLFEVLGKYGAKNASTVPEDKRQACIDEIDALLKGSK